MALQAPSSPPGSPPALLDGLQSAVGELQRAALDSERQLAGATEAAAAAEAEVRCRGAWAARTAMLARRHGHARLLLLKHYRLGPHMQAVLVGAYCRRLQRLAALLQQYDAELHRALAALGLAQEQQEGQHGSEQQGRPPATADALAALADGLQRLEQQLMTAALEAAEPPAPEALLQLGSDAALAGQAAAAGPAAIVQALQGEAHGSRLCT